MNYFIFLLPFISSFLFGSFVTAFFMKILEARRFEKIRLRNLERLEAEIAMWDEKLNLLERRPGYPRHVEEK